ncbi:hypothetical protein ELH44_08915 [Rhizobium ruizarguesonis]|uniref:hypothetical protein n=1 Tax=Rhizobium ruizarguesonis TaxID=2081791 RepID=UPI001030F984|nr:hypothetical protein [Rhizobium ruizarguesonis]TBB53781.1 hypothetical protein ELH44_08915 [Rhizobium ruizarguesonis]
MDKNEERICEATIGLLEKRAGKARSASTRPEKDHSGPPVEVRVTIGERRYAIEHTLVEPFENFIQIGNRFTKFVGEILDALKGTMPGPGIYQLSFPIDPTAEHKGAALAALRQPIIDWVHKAAEEMFHECPKAESRDRQPYGYNGKREIEIGGLHLILVRSMHWARSTKYDGFFDIARRADDNLEPARQARIKTALTKKLPKLLTCGDEGDVTILVLEFSDIALTHHVFIAQALEDLIAQGVTMPDQVFIADTTQSRPWDFYQPIADGAFVIDMEPVTIEPPENIGY